MGKGKKLRQEEIYEAWELLAARWSLGDIAAKLGRAKSTISAIKNDDNFGLKILGRPKGTFRKVPGAPRKCRDRRAEAPHVENWLWLQIVPPPFDLLRKQWADKLAGRPPKPPPPFKYVPPPPNYKYSSSFFTLIMLSVLYMFP